eukprot:UN31858
MIQRYLRLIPHFSREPFRKIEPYITKDEDFVIDRETNVRAAAKIDVEEQYGGASNTNSSEEHNSEEESGECKNSVDSCKERTWGIFTWARNCQITSSTQVCFNERDLPPTN